ncbi:phage tail protein [Methylobacterium sp. AMS5]|uniref:phage tail protein n=1 Tax=Methylobacterium sp. AMS5 TaxID=925818 RepID=UPI00074F9F5C|nr:phage tail protein [Methylobacterium sp. AMS5]AMB48258.1 hypothetical protein Y590_25155 [Methylobacterium sp. AMS5]
METFDPPLPPTTSQDKPEFKLLEADFGDGYTQTMGDGMNSVRRVVSLSWDWLNVEQADQIEGFIRKHKGADHFYYTLSDTAEQLKWTCKEITRTRGTPNKIECVFRQSFNLG